MRCAIWYHLYNLKNVKNSHGGVLILTRFRLKPATLLKLTLLHWYFSRFLNCTNGTKSRNTSHFKVGDRPKFFSYHLIFEFFKKILGYNSASASSASSPEQF